MSLLDLILERELSPEQREARRARAKARREKRRSQREEDDQAIHIRSSDWLRSEWRKFNKMYFDGKMTEPKILDTTRGNSLGRCSNDFDPYKEIIYCIGIYINPRIENYSTFRNTMVHEMVHQWCYEQLKEQDIKHANLYGMARSRRWWNALTRPMGKDGHHGIWLTKCEELVEKYPYLKLNKYGQTDEESVSDRELQKTMVVNKDCHIVLCEPGGGRRRYFYYLTDEAFRKLKKDVEAGVKSGKWTEYEFDPEKMAREKLTPSQVAGNSAFKGSYLDNLFERGVVKEWDYRELGGVKREGRRSRFRLW